MRTQFLLVLTIPTLLFLPVLARAQDPNIDFTLSPTSSMSKPIIAHPGQTLSFSGSLTDEQGLGTLILGDSWNIPYSGITLNDMAFQSNFVTPYSTGFFGTVSGKMFDLTFSKTVKDQLYNMTFSANVDDAFNGQRDVTQRFFVQIKPAAVPAPGSMMVALLGALGIAAGFAGKSRRTLTTL